MQRFSLEKKLKTPAELSALVDPVATKKIVDANRILAESSEIVQLKQGIFAFDYKRQFTIDGSIKSKNDPKLGAFEHFFSEQGRTAQKGNSYILRGSRYLVSIDPTLVVSQKVHTLEKDFTDALNIITKVNHEPTQEFFLEYSGVLDYLKNSAVTILNAFLQEEKLGKFKNENKDYQKIRSEMLEIARLSTHAFYAHLAGKTDNRDEALSRIISKRESMRDACSYVLQEYKVGIFSANYFTRPETSHPLVIMGAAFIAVDTAKVNPDTIVGLPSGGTEIAFVQQLAFQTMKGYSPKIELIPISFHSIKNSFKETRMDEAAFSGYMKMLAPNLKDKNILLVEDNSSTGRTIQKMVDLLMENGVNSVAVAVSEADIIRSTIDMEEPKRTHIASRETYARAVTITPISKKIKPKVDIKEIIEHRRLARAHLDKKTMQKEKIDIFIETVLAKMTTAPTELELPKLNDVNSIQSFRGTFLSNFYACKVEYNGKIYSSVEHAYQAQKFITSRLMTVEQPIMEEIHELLRTRGVIRTYENAAEIFADPYIASGHVKLVADILRTHGYVREDWDEMRMPVMAELLLQKYEDKKIKNALKLTSGKYLVEGNTWNDTLWGVSDGKGRNMLGQMIMVIRDEID